MSIPPPSENISVEMPCKKVDDDEYLPHLKKFARYTENDALPKLILKDIQHKIDLIGVDFKKGKSSFVKSQEKSFLQIRKADLESD